jgi:hypothetical protein
MIWVIVLLVLFALTFISLGSLSVWVTVLATALKATLAFVLLVLGFWLVRAVLRRTQGR